MDDKKKTRNPSDIYMYVTELGLNPSNIGFTESSVVIIDIMFFLSSLCYLACFKCDD